jgi:hypothetical protein
MFEASKHAELIAIGTPELDLSPKNKAKLEAWRKAFKANPKKCEVLRFMPSRKQFYAGGVQGVLWPGTQEWDMTNGRNKLTPSDRYNIQKDGYVPQSDQEAIRLLILSQDPQNRICVFEDRELGDEARTAEIKLQQALAREAKHLEEIETLRAKLEAKGGR